MLVMDNSIKITLIVVSAVVVLVLIGIFAFMQIMPGNTISAQGASQIKATPDLVTVYFSVQTRGATASEAKDKNSEIVDNAITNLIKIGIERKDIVTENFNVYPEYDYSSSSQRIKDYQTTHSIKIELSTSNTNKIGEVIDAGVDAGSLVSYINFELSQEKQNQYKAEALKLASEDARIKAESTASGLGKTLGRLVSVSSSNFDYYPWPIYRNDAMMVGASEAKSATTSIQPGKQDITASVSVVYKIR